jgi:hypothetical protein
MVARKRKGEDLTKRKRGGKMGMVGEPTVQIKCPLCKGNLIRVYPETRAVRMPVYCKLCREYPEINID